MPSNVKVEKIQNLYECQNAMINFEKNNLEFKKKLESVNKQNGNIIFIYYLYLIGIVCWRNRTIK